MKPHISSGTFGLPFDAVDENTILPMPALFVLTLAEYFGHSMLYIYENVYSMLYTIHSM